VTIISEKASWMDSVLIFTLMFVVLGKCYENLFDRCFFFIYSSEKGALTFYTVCMAGATLFFKLSIRWPYIIAFWYKKEQIFLYFPYKDTGKGLAKRIKTTAFTILGFALSMLHQLHLV
jgi:hypothetical protein